MKLFFNFVVAVLVTTGLCSCATTATTGSVPKRVSISGDLPRIGESVHVVKVVGPEVYETFQVYVIWEYAYESAPLKGVRVLRIINGSFAGLKDEGFYLIRPEIKENKEYRIRFYKINQEDL